jgi:AraC-like DNA-binding protein
MRTERTPYSTTLYLWKGVSAMFYSSFITPWHSHNTLQVVFDLRKHFRFRTSDGKWNTYKSLIIKENTIHRLKPGELVQCLLEPDKKRFEKIVHQLLQMLIDGAASYSMDRRVSELMHMLTVEPDGEATIRSLAERVYLSESRLRSLFKKSTGISLHRYIIVNKISLGVGMIMNGAAIEEAALGSGFTDGSHLHRMIRQLFGISPSQFIRDNAQKHIDRSDDSPLRLVTRQYDEE